MREIKFRGKEVGTNKWVYGYLLRKWGENVFVIDTCTHFASNGFDSEEIFTINPKTVGQYIGHKDKNGTEIYEDDIVLVDGIRFIVCFGENNFTSRDTFGSVGFYLKRIGSKYGDTLTFSREPYYEVIGNIHDNPELLEGK